MAGTSKNLTRREMVALGGSLSLGALAAVAFPAGISAAALPLLEVAYAGSMGSMMEGPLRTAVRRDLRLDMHGRAQGSNALARLISGGTIRPDIFISVTPGPMETVIRAGKANAAEPIADTEMVIAYSRKGRFASKFEQASMGHAQWWEILQEPRLRFGRTDPSADPQGRNIIFTMMLAAKMYHQPDLARKILGPAINPKQIFSEPTVLARLQSGELDASSAYKTQPGPFDVPYISLPREINLSSQNVRTENPDLMLTVDGKTYYPEPLIYYAAALTDALNPKGAAAFVQWLKGREAQSILRAYQYGAPDGPSGLRA